MELCEKFKKIKLLLSDVDGIMNDGRIYYVPTPEGVEIAKFFNVKDGLGIRLLQAVGIKFGVITGRSDKVVLKRCRDLNCDFVFTGVKDKGKVFELIQKEAALRAEEVLYVGDDINDLPALKRAGLSATVIDAPEEIKETVDYIVPLKGGEGVIRHLAEKILKCQNLYEEAVDKFLKMLEEKEKLS
jgi:3-deoxy-D-manno-octulosonate 8-phosphate phosphatase (KDO 8-P phosphatase)